ncbi:MAG: hypothetical protein IJT03_04485 [Clostridia bacterium]|nr:hypothetical protein [Clostridia bacterium]
MKNTIIASIVAVICTAALCLTFIFAGGKSSAETEAAASDSKYITETEAADYLGISEEVVQMLRVNLRKLEGSYMSYTYTDEAGKEVTRIVYDKDKLDDAVAALMKDTGALNFKYIQESIKK